MSTSDPALLAFVDERGVADLSVADARMRTVARRVGALEATLPAGLYRLEARVGLELSTRLIELEPGGSYRETAKVEVTTPTPLEGTANSGADHQAVAVQSSQELRNLGGTGAIIVVRALGDLAFSAEALSTLELVTELGAAVGLPWRIDHASGIASVVMSLPPGGYALRTPAVPSRHVRPTLYLEQAVNVAPEHQTLLFIPATRRGPRPELASIHMVRDEWSPSEQQLPGSLTADVMLQGLRIGDVTVPEFDLEDILGNPMLGVIAVHAIIANSKPDLEWAEQIAHLTEHSLRGGPDAADLSYVVEERRASDEQRAPMPTHAVTTGTPPMLRQAHDALVRWDIAGGSAFVDGSPAEVAAEWMVDRGVWTTRIRTEDDADRPDRSHAAELPMHAGPVSFPVQLADIGSDDTAIQSLGPAARRVASFLVSVAAAAAHDPDATISTVDERRVAGACGLPIRAVRRAHEELTSMLVPVG